MLKKGAVYYLSDNKNRLDNMIYEDIIKILEEKGVNYKIHEHAPVMTMQDVNEKLPFPKEKLVKTLVIKVSNSFWVLVAMKGTTKLDFLKLSTALGVKRGELTMPSVEEVESKLGFQMGGICPIPTNNNIKAVFDKKILDMDVVYCGVGRNDRSLKIELHDLLRVSNAIVCPIGKTK